MVPANEIKDIVQEFVTLFVDGRFAEMAHQLLEDGRESIIESFPEEFHEEEKMEVENALEAYRRGLYGQYGNPESIGDVRSDGSPASSTSCSSSARRST